MIVIDPQSQAAREAVIEEEAALIARKHQHDKAVKKARAELRDEFAKAALIGLLASGDGSFTYEKVREAWEIADAMLKARAHD